MKLASLAKAAAVAAAVLAAAPAQAQQDWPNRTVKIVVAFTAGGTTDILARMIGQRFADKFKQPFIVENKPGGAGNIGTEFVIRAPADGYTIMANSVGPAAVNPSLFAGKINFNAVTDLDPIGQIADVPNVLVVHPSTNIRTMEEFLKYAKANPDNLNYASTGIGTSSHLSGFLLSAKAGFKAEHIPYKGAEALKDLLAGRVQFMFATIPSVIQHIKAGKLTAIAVSSKNRSRSMPEVPTVAESGFPGFEAGSWFGFFAPKNTPRDVVLALNKALNEALTDKEIDARLVLDGADPKPGTPEEFGAFVKAEYQKWAEVVKASGAKAN
ncbi:MAG: tripartite tricarboxylate transporter substrate binding protein [Burkholderiales bacterium]|nr:tripartite tricarboxylate transporter substrate binding protein [Burkholderiales bacterium]MCL4687239.1 tripartite tricarboxylate transporter substrate binding protein [Burkholderiales bacterium]